MTIAVDLGRKATKQTNKDGYLHELLALESHIHVKYLYDDKDGYYFDLKRCKYGI